MSSWHPNSYTHQKNKQFLYYNRQIKKKKKNPHELHFTWLIFLPPIQCSNLGSHLFRLFSRKPKQNYPNLLHWGHQRCTISSLSFLHPLPWLLQLLALPRRLDSQNFYLSWKKMTLPAHWTWWRNAPSALQFQFSQPHWSQTLVLPFKQSVSEHPAA